MDDPLDCSIVKSLLPKDVEWLFCSTFQNTMKLQCGTTLDNFLRCPKDLCNGHYSEEEKKLHRKKKTWKVQHFLQLSFFFAYSAVRDQ